MSDAAGEATQEVEAALSHAGVRARQITRVSPLRKRDGRRGAYRVDTDDGRTIKARQVDTCEEARRLLGLRDGLDEAFAPAFGRHGCVLLEAWIEGRRLTPADSEARAAEGGRLLGRLHGRPRDVGEAATCETARWREQAMADLRVLEEAGTLTPAEVSVLGAAIARRDPGRARAVLIHQDFTAENMVIDRDERLWVIDNEQLDVGPAGFDLGRTLDRWPMSDGAWERFCLAYDDGGRGELATLGFWRIVVSAMGARLRLQRIPWRLDPVIETLRRLAIVEGR